MWQQVDELGNDTWAVQGRRGPQQGASQKVRELERRSRPARGIAPNFLSPPFRRNYSLSLNQTAPWLVSMKLLYQQLSDEEIQDLATLADPHESALPTAV